MNTIRALFCLCAIASLGSGCSASTTPTSPSFAGGMPSVTASQLAGTWHLLSMKPTGEADQATPPGASYSVTFADGRLSARADCNVCNGAFALSGQTLTAGPALACTRAACPTMAFENRYVSLLAGESTAIPAGNTLGLASPKGLLRFSR